MDIYIVQFTRRGDFITDLAAGETNGIYHELIEQRTASGEHGYGRWLLTTIIRAIVASGSETHVAALTIPHGREVTRLNGRILGPPGAAENEERRWREAGEAHEKVIDDLARLLLRAGLPWDMLRGGIVAVPATMPFVLAGIPLDEARADEVDAQLVVDYSPGGDGSTD